MEKLSKSQALSLGIAALNIAVSKFPNSVVELTVFSSDCSLGINSDYGQSHQDFCKAIESLYPFISPKVFSYSIKELSGFSACHISISYE